MARTWTVLNVDDDEAGRYSKSRVLERAGFSVVEAGTGAEALRIAAETPPDLVVLDVKLPDIDGLEVCRRLKTAPATSAIPVLQISAAARGWEAQVSGLESGADAYLSQPVEPDVFVATCKALLRVRAATLELRKEIDRRTQAEQALQQAQKLESIGVLAGGIAHEFNNLLTGILGNASLLLSGVPGSPEERLQGIMDSAGRAADLTRQMLAYAGKGQFVLQRLDVSQEVEQLMTLLQASIPKKVEVRLDLAPALPPVEIDPGQLQQIIFNLVVNAAEAVGENVGVVTVRTRPAVVSAASPRIAHSGEPLAPGEYVVLEVADTGTGMDAAILPRIFDPFFTTKFTGRGMGLAAVSGIVRSLGGSIEVESAPGAGSRFTILLRAATVATPAAGPLPAQAVTRDEAVVLVVDDERIVREVAQAMLRKAGYRVLTAANGREALEVVRGEEGNIDCILLDLKMPVMGGDEVLAELRKDYPAVPVVLSSGYTEKEALRLFATQGFAAFIQKPYSFSELARKVDEALRRAGSLAKPSIQP